jgi:hypothetical protein
MDPAPTSPSFLHDTDEKEKSVCDVLFKPLLQASEHQCLRSRRAVVEILFTSEHTMVIPRTVTRCIL